MQFKHTMRPLAYCLDGTYKNIEKNIIKEKQKA